MTDGTTVNVGTILGEDGNRWTITAQKGTDGWEAVAHVQDRNEEEDVGVWADTFPELVDMLSFAYHDACWDFELSEEAEALYNAH